MVSRFRCPIPIIGMTTSEKATRKLSLSWGVTPVLTEEYQSTDVMFYHAMLKAKELGFAQKDDNIIITGGIPYGTTRNTNIIKIETMTK